jgi:dihydroorotate dehydrogenase subfamily 2
LYRWPARPLLFALPPEAAQRFADTLLKRRAIWRVLAPAFRVRDERLRTDPVGISLANPVGLAAGYDKNCELLPSVAALGFGYVVGGTVTEEPRPGNPKPRMLRYVGDRSLINSLGFPGRGLEAAAWQLERSRDAMGGTPVVVSVSGVTPDEIVRCHRRLEPLVDAVELNISSPNTAGLRDYHRPQSLADLLNALNQKRDRPLFVKLPAPAAGEDADVPLALADACVANGVEGLTVANTRPAEDRRLATGAGGLSGKLIFEDMLRLVSKVRARAGQDVSINACGGIFTGDDAWRALQAGATTVQLLTGLIYRGPSIAKRVNKELLAAMDREGVDSLTGRMCDIPT